jgi:RNA polymerase sigma-70 factor (ECF subfamily)
MDSGTQGRAPAAGGTTSLTREAIARAKAGDHEGLHYLYVRYAEDVLRYVASLVRDHHEAEDITQNVFAKLISAIKKYEERDVPFDAWILRVARNAALDHLRAQSRRPIPSEEIRTVDTGRTEVSRDRGLALRRALEELPADQREVLVLRHVVGLSPVEIAGAVDKTESSIHGLHHRGRRSLKNSLVELDAAPVVEIAPT